MVRLNDGEKDIDFMSEIEERGGNIEEDLPESQ